MHTKPGSHMDPMTDEWDYNTVKDEYTDLCRLLHSLDIASHPWPLQDDNLQYRKTAHAETKMFITHGVDGFFVEFPKDSYRWFTELGNYSTLNFEHPLHTLQSKDLNLEIIEKCIADRYLHECMSNEMLFEKAAKRDVFLGTKPHPWVKNEHE